MPIGQYRRVLLVGRYALKVPRLRSIAQWMGCNPDTTAEPKPENFGRVGNAIVALDYGLPDADMIAERRAYYRKFNRPLFRRRDRRRRATVAHGQRARGRAAPRMGRMVASR